MEEKYLYPAFSIPHIGGGNDYVEYMLSAVLGSWGYVIRHLSISCLVLNNAEVVAFAGSEGEKTDRLTLSIPAINPPIDFEYRISGCSDLKLRYKKDGDVLSSPVWVAAYSLCRPAVVLDLIDRVCVVADTRQ